MRKLLLALAAVLLCSPAMATTYTVNHCLKVHATATTNIVLDDAGAACVISTNIGVSVQAYDADTAAFAGLTSGADLLPYFTGSHTMATTSLTSTARSLLDDTSTSVMRTTLGLAIGTNVEAWDPDLDAIAALSSSAGIVKRTGAGTFGLGSNGTDFTLITALSCSNQVFIGVTASGVFTCGNVTNASLSNSTISGVSLGSNLGALTFGTHLSSGGSSYNGSAGVTITSDATAANTVSTIVARDSSGNFAAGTITASLTGTASGNLVSGGALGTPSSGVGTNITGVNAATLGGATFASPGTIGGTAAGIVNSTTLNSSVAVNLTTSGSVDTYFTLTRATQASGQIGMKLVSTTGGTTWYIYNPTSSNTLTWYNASLGAAAMSLTTTGDLTLAGVLTFTGTAPTPTGTGTPSIASGSTDTSGEVTGGTLATSIVITFASSKANAPFCVVKSQTQVAAFSYTVSTTAITITETATTGQKIDYLCTQH